MVRLRGLVVVVLALMLFSGGWLSVGGQDSQSKAKGTLPQNWGKLGLSEEQKQKVYTTRADYRAKIGALEQQIDKLKAQEQAELLKILTDAQKARLREILVGKVPPEPEKKSDPEKK